MTYLLCLFELARRFGQVDKCVRDLLLILWIHFDRELIHPAIPFFDAAFD